MTSVSIVSTGQKTILGTDSPAMNCRAIFNRPYGTKNNFGNRFPGNELPGYFLSSLRD
ncbi:Uncharacterized protein dnm_096630 [Desulfonema magnum]|uniref:Uncharacterized protein n=1 Tax=Desulfonema magnum TaxID=45655 RepID=A0A975BXD7_9BACT|nr:Uncharacterized protein dnm_096630 [Desulfonema magnum]